jgi:hypothetical protein
VFFPETKMPVFLEGMKLRSPGAAGFHVGGVPGKICQRWKCNWYKKEDCRILMSEWSGVAAVKVKNKITNSKALKYEKKRTIFRFFRPYYLVAVHRNQ